MAAPVESWMCGELSKLGVDVTEENAKYILNIDNAQDLEDYLQDLLNPPNHRTKQFIKRLLEWWNQSQNHNFKVYRKNDQEQVYFKGTAKSKSLKSNVQHHEILDLENNSINGVVLVSSDKNCQQKPLHKELSRLQQDFGKRKLKFVPLYSHEGQARTVVKLPGRHPCDCQASKHNLIGNCCHCGRIVCEQEGSGACLFCANLVCTREEQEILSRVSKKSEKLRQQLMKDADKILELQNSSRQLLPSQAALINSGLDKALEHKMKLLEYDKSSIKRTQVIDDDADYFSLDSQWLSKSDREAMQRRDEEMRAVRHQSRRDRKITFDFAGRQILDAENNFSGPQFSEGDLVDGIPEKHERLLSSGGNHDLVNPNILQFAPKYVPPRGGYGVKTSSHSSSWSSDKRSGLRLQDRELQEMSDKGMCLSMHQPWASLLIAGIKKHEGRVWYTSHRGRLWIASTAKTPSKEEIAEVEQCYHHIRNDPNINFPEHYPVGCLLGCVELTDCLTQEQYQQQFPHGESESPYVFICESHQELVTKFSNKGKNKIYKLEQHIHQAVKRGLHKSSIS